MDVSQKASLLARKVLTGLQSYIGPVCAGVFPAGPDGIREQGSHLHIELLSPASLSDCPCPTCPSGAASD
jgi:hypothetical protein